MKIEIGKKYRTMNGISVRILAVDIDNLDYPVAVEFYGVLHLYTIEGLPQFSASNREHDLVEVGPYDYIKLDDRVIVWTRGSLMRHRRYFAGVSAEGRPLAFDGGGTFWTKGNKVMSWDFCELAEERILKLD